MGRMIQGAEGLAIAGLLGSCARPTRRDMQSPTADPTGGPSRVSKVELTAMEATVPLGEGKHYQAWTFNGTVPGPVVRVREGDTLHVTFTNRAHMGHSLDMHAARVDPSVAFRTIDPGESLEMAFKPRYAGAFLYHCGTQPVLMHIGAGMFGAIIVDPREPLPPAREYVLVYNEYYVREASGLWLPDYDGMRNREPNFAAFNGKPFGYRDAPLRAKVGERVRFYLVNAGPRHSCAFHIVGLQLDTVYPAAPPDGALRGVSTYSVPPGGGAIVEVVADVPGHFPFVNHDVGHGDEGAFGVLQVEA